MNDHEASVNVALRLFPLSNTYLGDTQLCRDILRFAVSVGQDSAALTASLRDA